MNAHMSSVYPLWSPGYSGAVRCLTWRTDGCRRGCDPGKHNVRSNQLYFVVLSRETKTPHCPLMVVKLYGFEIDVKKFNITHFFVFQLTWLQLLFNNLSSAFYNMDCFVKETKHFDHKVDVVTGCLNYKFLPFCFSATLKWLLQVIKII